MPRQAHRTKALLTRLGKLSEEQLDGLFAPGHVVVSLGRDVADKPQAQLAFTFAVNLLARLYPVVQRLEVLVSPDAQLIAPVPRWRAPTLVGHTTAFLEALSPDVEWAVTTTPSRVPESFLTLGSTDCVGHKVFLGTDGWEASVSSQESLRIGDVVNPVGAYAAACLGVGEVWKRQLYPHRALFEGIPIFPLEGTLTFSTFTYQVGQGQPNPVLPPTIDIGRLTMIGLGAGGGATAFVLASLSKLRGVISGIDPDEVDEPNLNRYVFADAQDASARRPKTELVKDLFQARFSKVTVKSHATALNKVQHDLSVEDYRYVLAAVHSRMARRDLQYETPMVLWDAAASEDGEFRIWRMILGVTECMHCKHPDTKQDPETAKAAQLDQLLGLGIEAWVRKVRDNEAFSDEEVRQLTDRIREATLDVKAPYPGQHFGDWEVLNCGRMKLVESDDEIPIPFAPVIAGVLLAGEIIKEHHFHEAVLDSYYGNTVVGMFMKLTMPRRRLPRLDCGLCRDPVFVAQYERRWGSRTVPPAALPVREG